MVINGLNNSVYGQFKLEKKQSRDDEHSVKNSSAAGQDKLQVSDNARLAGVALEAAQNTPDMQTEKVAQLKAMVQNGTYSPDSKNIAEKMITEEASLWR